MTAWDVRDSGGRLVTGLDGLAGLLRTTPRQAAEQVLADAALSKSAPEALLVECKARARRKPGGGTPPPISTGNFVSWSNGKGKVDLLVTSGKVPGVDSDVEGTAKSPAARVVVWVDGKPTRKKIGASTHTLRRIPPLDREKKSTDNPAEALVALHQYHVETCESLGLPEHAALTGTAIKSAYDRGVDAWPGYERTLLNRVEWGLGRAEHLVKVAEGEVEAKSAGHDRDLLHDEHPMKLVRLTLDDLDPTVRGLITKH